MVKLFFMREELTELIDLKLKKVLLPEMTWPEVKKALEKTNIAIIPLGSCEQHGTHLPVGTDHLLGLTMARTIAEKTGAVVAPILWIGYSEHHMGFPGTITLTAETLAQVLIEVCRSLSKHGFKKIILLNAHGGNDVACSFVAQKANMELLDTSVVVFGVGDISKYMTPRSFQTMDRHAGIDETAIMLALKPELVIKPEVDITKARKPTISLPLPLQAVAERLKKDPSALKLVLSKLPMIDEISDTGSLVFGNPADAAKEVESLKRTMEKFYEEVVGFIKEWKKI
jgi:creatinine amidohydrolase